MPSLKKKALAIIAVITTLVGLSPLLQLPLPVLAGLVGVALLVLILWARHEVASLRTASFRQVQKFSAAHDHVVFVYGSLLVKDSLLRTISRTSSEMECIPCYLTGYKVEWGALSTRNELLDKSSRAIQDDSLWASLTAVRGEPTDRVAGAVIGVSNLGYVALRNRERNYILKNVTTSVEALEGDAELPSADIMAFLPRQATAAPAVSSPRYIRRVYFDSVSSVLKRFGFSGLPVPDGFQLRDAYLVDEQVEKILHSRYGNRALKQVHRSVSNDLKIAKETRSIAYALRPLTLPRRLYQRAATAAEAAVSVSTKALKVLNENPQLLQWANYGESDIALLRRTAERGDLLPKIARVDMSLVGNRLLLFEVNSDSPGGMRHLDILSAKQAGILRNHPRLDWIDGQVFDTSEQTVRALESACDTGSELKRAVILEYRPKDWPTYPEMRFFRDTLEGRGIKTDILDLATESLQYTDGKLFSSTGSPPIDLVYKRILWKDLQKSHPKSEQALTDAFHGDHTCVVNSLGARIAGNKMIMAMLKAPEFQGWLQQIGEELTPEEASVLEENVPETHLWTKDPPWSQDAHKYQEVLDEPYRYVLKSFHGYGGKEVLIGCDLETPRSEFEDLEGKGYIVQEYVPHGRAFVPYFERGVKWEYHYYILGAYVIDGKCVAMEAKTANALPINMTQKALRTAVFPTK